MFTNFNAAERAVHYPADRRLVARFQPGALAICVALVLVPVGLAWAQYLAFGLPTDPSARLVAPTAADPQGFPAWLRIGHWVNFFFLMLIVRSGLSILADHARLYWNNGCAPGTDWLRFTPVAVPTDRVWTAKEDARYLSPALGLPGYRHTVGLARHWHFITVPFFLLNGAVFIALLFFTNQWRRLVPTSWQVVPDAWSIFVHYATFHLPVEPNGFFHYNALQQVSYFAVVFLLAPISMLSGIAMSPAIENRFHWFPKLFGSRQGARSVHFLVTVAYVVFTIIHVTMVAATGLTRNMNHMGTGRNDSVSHTGLWIGAGVLLLTVAAAVGAQWVSWQRPRALQQTAAAINGNLWRLSIDQFKPTAYHKKADITPYFWLNGKLPDSEQWRTLAATNFQDFRLSVGGLVENPVELSLADLKALGLEQNITMHHCIQGWSGIAEWGGLPLRKLVDLVRPHAAVTTVAFYSFGEGLYGGAYYDTHTLANCLKPASILAWEMNYAPLSEWHGAPLRLRVENQLGYKMVKWVCRVEFVESHEQVGKGFGGKNEDDEYFDLLADT